MRAKAARLTNSSSRAAHSTALRRAKLGAIEEVGTGLVADVPRIEVGCPALELRFVHQRRVVDHAGQELGLMIARRHRVQRQPVVCAYDLGDAAQLGHRNAERARRC